jgi:hypothetical protein
MLTFVTKRRATPPRDISAVCGVGLRCEFASSRRMPRTSSVCSTLEATERLMRSAASNPCARSLRRLNPRGSGYSVCRCRAVSGPSASMMAMEHVAHVNGDAGAGTAGCAFVVGLPSSNA